MVALIFTLTIYTLCILITWDFATYSIETDCKKHFPRSAPSVDDYTTGHIIYGLISPILLSLIIYELFRSHRQE